MTEGTRGGFRDLTQRPEISAGVPTTQKMAERLRARLDERAIVPSRFVNWSPVSIGFSGELELEHTLGTVPSGLILIQKTLDLKWTVPALSLAKWTASSVFIDVEVRHPWELGEVSLANGVAFVNISLVKATRPDTCEMNALLSMQDNQSTDRPPLRVDSTITSGGFFTGLRVEYGDGGTQAFTTMVEYAVNTDLHTSDKFVWQVI